MADGDVHGSGPRGPAEPTRLDDQARDDEIVAARFRGIPTRQLARTYGLTERRIRQIVAEWRAANPPARTRDPLEIVDEMLEQYQGAAEELAMIAATTPAKNASARVGAIRGRVDVLRTMTELLQATGVLPKDLGKLRVEVDVRFVAETILRVMHEEGVPDDVQRRIIGAIERGRAGTQN